LGTLKRGVSFGEAVVAIFLILSSVIVTVTLFHSGMRYASSSQRRALAAVYGRKVMQQIRGWARVPANFDSDWSTYNNVVLTDPDYPGMEAQVDCVPTGRELLCPASELERDYGPRANSMERSVVPVRVQIDWGISGREVRLVSLVGAPERGLPATLQVINTGGGLVAPLGIVDFTTQLNDSASQPIPDVTYSWSILPITGNATLLKDIAPRDGSTMQLKHEYEWNPLMTPPQIGPISGQIEVEVVCRYRGTEVSRVVPIQLQ
jgi:hypothetical protein